MAMPSFAFSVHNFISSVGADAGFAAIIGLAVLVLLYFAHARETANLREEAALLVQRLQQAEARVAQLSRPQPAAQVQAAPETPAALPAPVLAPFAPAGTAAPSLAAATRVIPVTLPTPEPAIAAPPEPLEAPAPAIAVAAMAAPIASALVGATAPAATAAPPAPPARAAPAPPADDASAVGPPEEAVRVAPPNAPAESSTPATASSGGPPVSSSAGPPALAPATASSGGPPVSSSAGPPAPATAAGGNGAGRRVGGQAPVAAGPAWSGTSPPPSGPLAARRLPPLEASPKGRRPWLGRTMAVAVVALAGVAAAVVLLAVTSVGAPRHTQSTPTTNAPGSRHSPSFTPSSVTVSVLNGTATNQLAHRIAAKLAAGGYKEGTIATAANQTQTTTVVGYVGARNRADALHVASALGLRPSAVRPVDQSTLQVACPVPSACTANVVVTVGADLTRL